MRDELLWGPIRPDTAARLNMSHATIMYWTEMLANVWVSGAVPPSTDALGDWIVDMDMRAIEHMNYMGMPEGWEPLDDEGGAP